MDFTIVDDYGKKDFVTLFKLVGREFDCRVLWNYYISDNEDLVGDAQARCFTEERKLVLTKPRHITPNGIVHMLVHELAHLLLNHTGTRINWEQEFEAESIANIVVGNLGEWDPRGKILITHIEEKLGAYDPYDYYDTVINTSETIKIGLEKVLDKLQNRDRVYRLEFIEDGEYFVLTGEELNENFTQEQIESFSVEESIIFYEIKDVTPKQLTHARKKYNSTEYCEWFEEEFDMAPSLYDIVKHLYTQGGSR